MRKALQILLTSFSAAVTAAPALAADDVMVVFDGSNSMWGQIDGTAKIEIAREVIGNLTAELEPTANVGLMAYGHRQRGDCSDIEVVLPPAPLDRAALLNEIAKITPTGKTPLTDAVAQAAEALSFRDRPATVVLISDGVESCQRDPCALAGDLERRGVEFTAHVVGFGLGANEDTRSLACIADQTGGQYIAAADAAELGAALSTVGAAVAQSAPEPEPEPEPAPEPQFSLTAPDSVTQGATFEFSWDPAGENPRDYVTIVPMGAEDGTYESYIRVKDQTTGRLVAPAEPGLYDLRYMLKDTGTTAGNTPVEVVPAQVTVSGPDSAMTGASFDVTWTGAVHPRDYVTIVPMGTEDGKYESYFRVGEDQKNSLVAPAQPGLYELRYMLKEGAKVMARAPLEVTEPEVTVSGPDSAMTGASFDVTWTGAVHPRDYVTIVPMGTEDGKYESYFRVGEDQKNSLVAPAQPGLYELRYMLKEGAKVMARAPLEVTEPEVTVSGPDSAMTGASFDVTWTGAVHPRDYVTIVPMGTEDGKYESYFRVGEDQKNSLVAPAQPGLYELRYMLKEGAKVMARAPLEVTEPEVTVSGPDSAMTGASFDVTWTGAVHPRDYVTIVPMGTEDGKYESYFRVGEDQKNSLVAPAQPGLYELRYMLKEGAKVMARAPLEVTEPEVTVSGPDQVRAGDEVLAEWTGAVHPRDYVTLVPMGTPDEDSGDYKRVGDHAKAKLTAPEASGLYELRYVLNEGKRVMARHSLEVLSKEAQLSTGAQLQAPDSAAAGATIKVSWSVEAESSDQRITLAKGNQPIFTWIVAHKIDGPPPMQLTLPEAPGHYELRFLDVAGQKVLSRAPIEVK